MAKFETTVKGALEELKDYITENEVHFGRIVVKGEELEGFLGDTWYNDAYVSIGQKYDIDVAIFDIGWNEPGAFDKMTPYDAARLGKALKAKVLIPDHWENWANSSADPDMLVRQFEDLCRDCCPECKTVIMRCAGQFNYPQDQDIKRYRYPTQSENFRLEYSSYGKKLHLCDEKKDEK